jgi:steroid 5-alpha reductase family enzyme
MSDVLTMLGFNFAGLIGVILILWAIAVRIRDVSFIDAFWAFGMVLLAWASAWRAGIAAPHGQWLLGLTTLWGLRLAIHLFLRWRTGGEDPRYQKILGGVMKQRGWSWGFSALTMVFLMQAPLLFLTCLPAQIGIRASAADPASAIGLLGWLGIAAALVGIAFETIGDAQLDRFRKNPASKGKVLDTGLWRYTRHPNYFGDTLTWWGIWLLAADIGIWVALASVVGPVFLTFTLTRWSGKALLEKGLHKSRPGYADYVQRTSGFIPWPPKTRA